MKKTLRNLMLITVMAVLCIAMAMTASAERAVVASGECGAQGDNVVWTYYDDGEIVFSGSGKMKDFGEVIENGGFCSTSTQWFNYEIQKVTFQEGITYIGAASFNSFGNSKYAITEVNMADTVEAIGCYAFSDCVLLSDISFSDSVTEIGDCAFYSCESIADIQLPGSVTKIGKEAFVNCPGIKTMILPDSVTTVGERAFAGCTGLENIVFSDSVTSLGDDVLIACRNLKNITLGKGITDNLFEDDNYGNLSTITVSEYNPVYSSDEYGVLFNKDKTKLLEYPKGNERSSYTVPSGVTTIVESAFAGCSNLNEVILPDTLTTIESFAFEGTGLKGISFPESLTTIGECAFYSSCGIRNVTISEAVEKIEMGAFTSLFFLDKITIENMDAELGEYLTVAAEYIYFSDITFEEFWPLLERWEKYGDEAAYAELEKYMVYCEDIVHFGTFYCHSGSTAEAYAIANGVDYVLTHFYEDEWTYDYDQMIRSRKCKFCDESEVEALEITTEGDVEIIEPSDPDTDFVVDEIEKTGDSYLLIQETVTGNLGTEWDVLKAFDINLKNKDGVHVQPDGTVKVKLPLNWEKDGSYKVYRVNDDGTLTDMNAYRQGSHMVFETDHFSIYIIVGEGAAEPEEPENPEIPKEEETDFISFIFGWVTDLFNMIREFLDLIF